LLPIPGFVVRSFCRVMRDHPKMPTSSWVRFFPLLRVSNSDYSARSLQRSPQCTRRHARCDKSRQGRLSGRLVRIERLSHGRGAVPLKRLRCLRDQVRRPLRPFLQRSAHGTCPGWVPSTPRPS
jgi:hypothetical protein